MSSRFGTGRWTYRQVDVLQAQVRVTACADSLATVGLLAGDVAAMFTPAKS